MQIKIFVLLSLLTVVLLTATNCKNPYRMASESWMIRESKDILVIGAKGYGRDKRSAQMDAEKRAFEVLFYQGIPNSSYRFPMLEKGKQDEGKVASFFSSNEYRNFVTDSKLLGKPSFNKTKRTKEVDAEVTINVLALRRHLEQKGTIQKFGL